ncbi:hypothetical protein POTOM_017551 [Populus tomentosa]|uniref:KIB1-4 beta-propeller domain-containing protein n=1 Tax=Populus tomentosa TaxID=118781 RepID=A0A8X8A0K9_POPTO|nr:hypothetical protein POTOM_017551 [Populus tomentosa]
MPRWDQLLSDVLLPILIRQSFIDVQRVKTVCSHWNYVAKQLKLYTKFYGIPCLLIPPRDEEGNANSKTSTRKHIKSNCYSVLKNDIFIVLKLPAKDTFLGRTRDDMDSGDESIIEFSPEAASTSRFYREWTCSRQLREHFVQKGILPCDPCHYRAIEWYYSVVKIQKSLSVSVETVGQCHGWEFVHGGANPVLKEDSLIDEDIQPLVCPYWTLQFRLFRMDFEQKPWVDMESLEDRALFIGVNHSALVLVPNCGGHEQNSINFTNDSWGQMTIAYMVVMVWVFITWKTEVSNSSMNVMH